MNQKFWNLRKGLLIATIMMGGCIDEGQELIMTPPRTEKTDNAISVNLVADIKPAATVSNTTLKVTDNKFDPEDQVGIYILHSGQLIEQATHRNVQMRISTDGPLKASTDLLYPDATSSVDIIGYHPYTRIGDGVSSIPVIVSGQFRGLAEEILYAKVTDMEPTASPVQLKFQYSLAKVEVEISSNSHLIDYAGITATLDGLPTKAKLSLCDGRIVEKEAVQPISMYQKSCDSKTAIFEMLAIPTENVEVKLTFLIEGKEYTTEMELMNIEAGKRYQLSVNINFPDAALIETVILPREDDEVKEIFIDIEDDELEEEEEEEEEELEEKHEHHFGDWFVLQPATDTQDGLQIRTCLNDATHFETRTIPRLYTGFLGRGYNIIDSRFYNSADVTNHYMLDMGRLQAEGKIVIDRKNQRSVETRTIIGEDLIKYSMAFSNAVGLTGKYGQFSASVNVDFNITGSIENHKSFGKHSTIIIKEKHSVSALGIQKLRDFLDPEFRENFLMNPNVSPSELMKNFGSHLLLSINLGGRLDMSYLITNDKREDSQKLTTKVNAAFAVVSGSANSSMTQNYNSLRSSSSETIKSYGGSVALNMQTIELARQNYEQWAQSIENSDNLALVNAGNLASSTEMLPIWELINPQEDASSERRNSIIREYEEQLEKSQIELTNMVYSSRYDASVISNSVKVGTTQNWLLRSDFDAERLKKENFRDIKITVTFEASTYSHDPIPILVTGDEICKVNIGIFNAHSGGIELGKKSWSYKPSANGKKYLEITVITPISSFSNQFRISFSRSGSGSNSYWNLGNRTVIVEAVK